MALLLVTGCGDTEIQPPASSGLDPDRAAAAQHTLQRLQEALARGSDQAAAGLAAPGAEALLKGVVGNASAMGMERPRLRFVADEGPVSGESATYPSDAWVGSVQLEYTLSDWDPGRTRLESSVVFAPSAGKQLIVGFGDGAKRTPVWLTGAMSIRSADRVHVIAADAPATSRLLRQGTRAVEDVERVLPEWTGNLVIEAPASVEGLNAALGVEPDQYASIAAVTSSADGSITARAPFHVFLNPDVFDRLGGRGAQVVLSHEATHVATGAGMSRAPKWLVEGFADYVALLHADVPVAEASGQVLAQVRRDGPPRDLPSAEDLDPSANELGATYEEAWLACRFVAEQYGQEALVRFYVVVDEGTSVDEAFRTVLGTTQEEFVAAWSRDVERLAKELG